MRSSRFLALILPALLLACSGGKGGSGSHADEVDDGGEADAGPAANTAPNSLDDVIQSLVAANGASTVSSGLYSLVASVISDPTAQQQIDSEIDARIAGQTSGPFPVIPFSILGNVLTLLDEFDSSSAPAAASAPVMFNLDPSGSTCTPAFPTLSPINAQLPGLSEGNIPNTTADPCALSQLQAFVTALNGMAMNDGSTVTDGANTYSTVADTIADLLATHTVTVEANRYYADFLGLYYNGVSVAAPVWVDYGIPLPAGGTLVLPVPHSGYSIQFAGPQLNGTVEFYMGVTDGTAFRAYVAAPRAAWQGGRAQYTYNSGTDNAKIVQVMQTASDLRFKWITAALAQNLPIEGYGTLGVCMDSAAVIEYDVEGTITLFPLAHPSPTSINDYIDAILSNLPSDLQGFNDADAIARIGTSTPMAGSALEGLFPLAASSLTSLGVLPAN
jgi:hypothetical protein